MVSKATMHENLIEAVREHEVLYNSDMKEYNDNILKMRLWRMIARKCDIPSGEEAKKIWKNLRDGFRCSIKTLKLYANKEPPRALKPWKYADQMEFLRPFMKDRVFSNAAYYENEFDYDSSNFDMQMENTQDSTQGSVGDIQQHSNENTHGSIEETIECRPDIEIVPPSILQQTLTQSVVGQQQPQEVLQPNTFGLRIEMIKSEVEEAPTEILTANPILQLQPAVTGMQLAAIANLAPPPKKRGRKKRLMDLPEYASDASQQQKDNDGEDVVEDSLKLFFDSMYATARALPPQLQRVIRIKLFQAVTDAEIAAESMDLSRNTISALNNLRRT